MKKGGKHNQNRARVTALRAAEPFASPVRVDIEEGVIYGAAIMTVGPALGYPFEIDEVTLRQAKALIDGQGGSVKSRIKHPEIKNGQILDDMGTTVGRCQNVRIESDGAGGGRVLRGDIRIGDFARVLPGYGDARTYLLGIAAAQPTDIGLSAVIAWTPDEQEKAQGRTVARLAELSAVDFVGKAAANPNGLLAGRQNTDNTSDVSGNVSGRTLTQPAAGAATFKGDHSMDPKVRAALVAMGLDSDASDEQAQEFHDGLTPEQQAACDAAVEMMGEFAAPAGKTPGGADTASGSDGENAAAAKLEGDDDDRKAAPLGARVKAATNLVALEARRVAEITQLGAILRADQNVVSRSIGEGHDLRQARTAMLAALKSQWKAQPTVLVGRDNNLTSLQASIPEAIMLRANAKVEKPSERGQKFAAMSLVMMGRHYLAALGAVDAMEVSTPRMAQLLLSPRMLGQSYPQVAALAQSTGDFPSILANTLNKTLRNAYLDAPKTWPVWARRVTAPDFKPLNRDILSESPSLTPADDGAPINYVTLGDGKESYSLVSYNGGIKLTWKAVVNDDLNAFSRLPILQANAASRLEEDVAYAAITANAALSDSVALFHGTHANLVSTTAAKTGPGVTSLANAEALMLKQKGPKGHARLELQPKFILVPTSLKASTEQFLGSSQLLAIISTSSSAPQTVGQANPYSGKFTVVSSTRLDDDSATAWYLLADHREGQIDTIELAFLEDEPAPVLRQETDFDSQDIKYAIRHTVAAKAIDFRGMVKNPGA